MLKQPRRSAQICRFKFAQTTSIQHPISNNYSALIYLKRNVRIFWYNFEAIRLQLTWTLSRKRRLSKKMFYKQKKRKKATTKQVFKSINLNKNFIYRVWVNGFPHLPYTTKPKGGRMGKGKGSLKAFFFKAAANHALLLVQNCNLQQVKLVHYKISRVIPGISLTFNYHYKIVPVCWD